MLEERGLISRTSDGNRSYIVAHGLLEYRQTDDVTGSLCSFILFNMARGFDNVREIISDYEKKALKKPQHELLIKTKNGESETKRVLDDLKIPKLEEIFTTVAIECHRYQRLAVSKMFSQLYCFMQVKAFAENFLEKLYTSKMKTKVEEETKSSVWDLKMP